MENILIIGENLPTLEKALERLGMKVSNADSVEKLREEDFISTSAVYVTGAFLAKGKAAEEFITQAIGLARENGAAVIFDPMLRAFDNAPECREAVNRIAAMADVFLPNAREAAELSGISEDAERAADFFLEKGTKKVVVKLGKQGALYKSRVEKGVAPTFRADSVVDFSGAGDGFAAGLISGICEEIPLGEAVVRANAVGSMQIQAQGEDAGLPTMAELREYMLTHRFVVDGCKEI